MEVKTFLMSKSEEFQISVSIEQDKSEKDLIEILIDFQQTFTFWKVLMLLRYLKQVLPMHFRQTEIWDNTWVWSKILREGKG